MPDTVRTQAQLLALFADNTTGLISAQDARDFIVTAVPSWWTVVSTPGSESVDFGGTVSITPTDVSAGHLFMLTAPENFPSGNILMQLLDFPGDFGYIVKATGQTQVYLDSDHATAAWNIKSYPGDRLDSPLHDIFEIGPFGSTRIWADSDIDALTLFLVDNGVAGGRHLVASNFAISATGAIDFTEQSAPAAPAANTGRLYVKDTGGKSQLLIRFPSGAAQVIATEP